MFTIERIEIGRNEDAWEFATEIVVDILNGKFLGSGVFGSTYKVGDEVIKIFRDDTGYSSYLRELSKQEKQNSFAPVINWVKVIDDGYDPTTMVSMEPLRSVSQLRGNVRKTFNKVVDHIDDLVHGNTLYLKYETPAELKELAGVIRMAKKNSQRDGYDLHNENIMLRANNSIVITDPLAY